LQFPRARFAVRALEENGWRVGDSLIRTIAETLDAAKTWCVIEGDVDGILSQEMGDVKLIPCLPGVNSFIWACTGIGIKDIMISKAQLLCIEATHAALLDSFSRRGDMLVCCEGALLTETLYPGSVLPVPDLRWGPVPARLSVAETGIVCMTLGRRFCALVPGGNGDRIKQVLGTFYS
jgi:hypothetical protein